MTIFTERWAILTAAPHRPLFLGGALQLVATVLFWGAELTLRMSGHGTLAPPGVPAIVLHAYLMLFTLFPFFVFGFLMTTYPRWMGGPPVPRGAYVGTFLALVVGVVAIYASLALGRPALVAGALAVAAGYATALVALWRVYRAAPATDKHYERHLNAALALALFAQAAFVAWLLGGSAYGYAIAVHGGLWLFLVPVLVTVGHRMIPYFSANAVSGYRAVHPRWSLPLMWAGSAGHAAAELLGFGAWRLLPDALLFAVALHLTLAWRLSASLPVRLLAVLHVAFAGLALGMGLFVVQDLAALAGHPALLGRAPLHVLGIGFVASLAVGMASRVTLGHSGRALELDGYGWACFLGVEAAMVLRVVAETPGLGAQAGTAISLLAALAWLAATGAWVVRFAPMLVRRRVDGQPG